MTYWRLVMKCYKCKAEETFSINEEQLQQYRWDCPRCKGFRTLIRASKLETIDDTHRV